MPRPHIRQYLHTFALLSGLLVTLAVYFPGFSGGFLLDDSSSILNNERLKISALSLSDLYQAALSGTGSAPGRPISMLSFALNYYYTGLSPLPFKITNAIIHLINGIGIFFLTYLLFSAYRKAIQPSLTLGYLKLISFLIFFAWLLHPLNLTTVLYIVQRMTSLSALFFIWGLILYLHGRMGLYEGKKGVGLIFISLFLFGPLALLSKENGALLPAFMLIIEITVFRFHTAVPTNRGYLYVFFIISILVPVLWIIVFLATNFDWITSGYQVRDFSLGERVMTEARVLLWYLKMIILPNITEMGLYHDDIVVSRTLFQPPSTVISILGIIVLLLTAVVARRRAPILSLGLLFFFVGHSIESTIISLELTHEHRNYFPMYGILLIIFYYLTYPLRYNNSLRLRTGFASILVALFAFSTAVRATYWGNPIDHGLAEVENHPRSVRANYQIGRTYAILFENATQNRDEYYHLAKQYFEEATSLQDNATEGLFGLVILNFLANKDIERASIKLLTYRLQNGIFRTSNVGWLMYLVKCQIKGLCNIQRDDLTAILDAAITNPGVAGRTKASVLTAASIYYIAAEDDYETGIKYAAQAAASSPNDPEYRLNLIKLLIKLRQFDTAAKQLTLLESRNRFGIYRLEISKYRNTIEQSRSAKIIQTQ